MKGILFNQEMVKAILSGKKTSTRRIFKGYIPEQKQNFKPEFGYTAFTPKGDISCRGYFGLEFGEKFYKLPYQVGDILYVRETWCQDDITPEDIYYKANYSERESKELFKDLGLNWRPSIHMPRFAARIFLKVTDVRVERIQDITEDEAKAEGVRPDARELFTEKQLGYTKGFRYIWDKLYGNWDENVWVWVIEFKVEKGDMKCVTMK